MVKELILDNDRVALPGLGSFVAEVVPSTFSDKGYTINPPYRRLHFRSKPDEGRELAGFYASPTHLMAGAEYDEVMEVVETYADKFESVRVAEPLLGEVGSDATVINEDKKAVAEIITAEAVKDAGFDSIEAAKEDGTAFVFMGHGTHHTAMVTYSQMQTQMNELGYDNVFIGTVEGDEAFLADAIIENVAAAGYTKVVLRPLMVVAGDHANNDMAGAEEDAWLAMFNASGKFESVDAQVEGLGQIEAIQQIYVDHTAAVLK